MTHPMRTPVLAADGGLIRFALADLLGAALPPMRIELTDAGAAEPWLTRLVGAEASLTALRDGRVDVPARPELARLALLLWARRWWPASPALGIPSLDSALLDFEAAVATAAVEDLAEGLLDGFEASPAELFDQATSAGLFAAAGPGTEEVRLLCEQLSAWFDRQDDLERSEAAAGLAARVGPGQRAYALAAGAAPAASGGGVLAEGRASVDWARVPPGVLDAAEGTVTWRIVATRTAARLAVEVSGALDDASLSAVATHDGEPFAEVALHLGSAGFAGTTDLDEAGARLAATSSARIGLVVGAVGPDVQCTAPEDRAEVISLVRARESLPPESRTLAERAVADEEF
ncbi:hypothetical protein L3Q65_15480 [Amycolatopsis sp. FU40]|uniref:hypothetical protein n=1 Tax=Amycolatopsis sp. FU40 TaxID=2914159 RepID=UPI001F1DF77C|nr:hypothetical protein [Amycolatopsis sp. FU40]UKD58067.1 hypothetical protein L3Q65_15480 [Amycolatopsis sp. FU40]